MKKIVLLGAMLLAGCGSSAPLFTSDGRPTIQFNCSGDADCQSRAESICQGSGYDVLRSNSNGASRSLLIACRTRQPK